MLWQTEEIESVACDLCGSTDHKPVITRSDGLSAVECMHCALCYLNPRPNPQRVAKLYSADYFQQQGQNPKVGYANYFEDNVRGSQRLGAQGRFATIRKYVSFRGKRCLEIGCATGEFSALLHRKGLDATAIDISEEAIRHAKDRFPNVDFKCGDVASIVPGGNFDLVCAFEVIEHVLSPRKFLEQIAGLLSNGGVVVLSTPNYDCANRLGENNWIGFHTSFEHLYFLSPATCQRYAENCGFDVIEWLTDRSTGEYIGSSGQRKPTAPLGPTKRVLDALGLLLPARSLKNAVACRCGTYYIPRGVGHNLFVILKKTNGT
jgi:2-polyprenyl-3-methyl-5-hydroxy-6-metoxy-1,4-benzoquinol methylase